MISEEITKRYKQARERLWPGRDAPQRPVTIAPRKQAAPPPAPKPEPAPPPPAPVVATEPFDWRKCLGELALRYGVSPLRVMSTDRSPACVVVRVDMIHILKGRGWSSARIGKLLNRDHTSVAHLHHKYQLGKPVLDGLRSRHNRFTNRTRSVR